MNNGCIKDGGIKHGKRFFDPYFFVFFLPFSAGQKNKLPMTKYKLPIVVSAEADFES